MMHLTNDFRLSIACLSIMFLSACAACGAAADHVLVLKNGNVLQGEVSRDHDRFVVSDRHSEIAVQARDVEFSAPDLSAAYERKSRSIASENAESHLNLARWCFRQGLAREAQRQLSDAAQKGADPSTIEVLRRQVTAGRSASRTARLPNVAASTDVTSQPNSKKLPQPVLAEFVNTVQPLLLNRCSNAKCHGPATETAYQLRPSPWRRVPRRLTEQNLAATLEMIDLQQPHQSLLLVSAAAAHGNSKQVPLHQRQLASLYAWVQKAAGTLADRSDQPQPATDPLPKTTRGPLAWQDAVDQSADPFDPERFNQMQADRAPRTPQ